MDNFKEEQREVNVQANHEINTVESSLNKELDGFQREIDQKFDIQQESISKLTNQIVHKQEENSEKECMIDTTLKEEYKLQDEEILPLLSKENNGEGAVEEHQGHKLPLPPSDSMYIQPTPAAQFTPEAPTPKVEAIPSALLVQYFKKLVATTQTFATMSKTLVAAYIAWHSGWFGCWFRHGALGPQYFCKLQQFQQPPKA